MPFVVPSCCKAGAVIGSTAMDQAKNAHRAAAAAVHAGAMDIEAADMPVDIGRVVVAHSRSHVGVEASTEDRDIGLVDLGLERQMTSTVV